MSHDQELLTSASWDIEMSAKTFAAGCTMSRSFIIVAPSFEMVTLPCKKTLGS